MALVSLLGVAARKYDVTVLSDINWNVELDTHWAVIGPNGSGKTVLLDLIAGKWPVSKGKISYDLKVPLRQAIELVSNDYSFNRIVNAGAEYYQQRFHAYESERAPSVRAILTDQLKPVGTVNDNSVKLGPPTVSDKDLDKVSALLSITHLLDHPFVTLSNGETRRMLLAKSLLKKPEILILDNAFSGLDVHSREVLRNALSELAASGVTIIMATTATEIPPCITNVLELNEGRISGTFHVTEYKTGFANHPHNPKPDPEKLAHFGLPQHIDFEYAIDLRNINVRYHDQPILENVNWKIAKGEKWALSGPNGSGKSTLLSIITADNPQRFANDYDLFDKKRGGTGASIWDIKQKIGHVSPELHLYFPRETSVFKTIASGFFDATGVFFKKLTEQQTERVHEVAALLHVAHLIEKKFSELSKGQQRMVLLARALVKNPPLLILDEPCQGLDADAIAYFKAVVDAICDTPERTLIYVSHYPHEIPSCVTKTLRLDQGKVIV
ncbi:ATP-binding cassette domain-containing protein [Dyadobacter fanqingshengii]|uniref:ATP-binding cassette domain-containing protein n=1 Tax=Dyadobacter fanqingshengii TaxID=2906443 RepID=A0A9X1PFZ3_9BACT|nr:ATP-binding cassette domain-containing protein [Dyadobacter fanqingshengii]MCF0043125.1 ATP-binding cassette domain-containing protein [Dyadobacter fanqingshengii]MCF0043203.1 ATP-binding cassette domain-containing protein [Dyadobacter fanqingshengii]USJ35678.1 ATP-binding cassette domain-containing protein [Dyadobacter fanqingshengii]